LSLERTSLEKKSAVSGNARRALWGHNYWREAFVRPLLCGNNGGAAQSFAVQDARCKKGD
jgi:hypothetical protein